MLIKLNHFKRTNFMKKTFLIFAFTAAVLSLSSCKSETKTTTDATTETTIETTTETPEMAYACPMDCEKGKTYAEKGKCPVCEMDLIASSNVDRAVDTDRDYDDHEGHNH